MPVLLDRLHEERRALLESVDRIAADAETEERDLSDSDRELVARHHARIGEVDAQIEPLEQIERQRAEHLERVPVPVRQTVAPAGAAPSDAEPYSTFAQYARDVLIVRFDAIAQRAGGVDVRRAAEARIERVVANTLSSDVAGLVPPQYLTQIAQVINKSRPIVDSARRIGLTSGQLMYPSITTRPLVGKQTAQKTEAPSQTMAVAFVTVTADTYVGAGDISWQAINWSTPDALQLWFDLAAEQYAIQTEAATGTVIAAATVMATPAIPATPTLADWMTAITAAAGTVYAAGNRRANTIYADVSSGYSIIGLVSNTSPIFVPAGGFSLGTGAGNIAGLNLVISKGLPAKTVVVGDSQALLAAETAGAPVELRAVEPALGGMEVGVIGAFVSKIIDATGFRKLTIA